MERTIKLHPDKADSGNGKSQKMDFFFNPKTWDMHFSSDEKSLKSIDELLNKKRFTSTSLVKELGKDEAVKAILFEVENGNPPIVALSNNSQLAMKFL
jgi:hypothetical protein